MDASNHRAAPDQLFGSVTVSRSQMDALAAARRSGRLNLGSDGRLYCAGGPEAICTLRTAATLVSRGWMKSVDGAFEVTREGLAVEGMLREQSRRDVKRRSPRPAMNRPSRPMRTG